MSKWAMNWLFEEPRILYTGLRNEMLDSVSQKTSLILLYDVDNQEIDLNRLCKLLDTFPTSYIIHTTEHGYHVIGLSPIHLRQDYGKMFDLLQKHFPSYYSGGTVRLTERFDGEFNVVKYNFSTPCSVRLMHLLSRFLDMVSLIEYDSECDPTKTLKLGYKNLLPRTEIYGRVI